MTDSDSDSDCFQSADEFEGDEEATSYGSDPRNSSIDLTEETNSVNHSSQSGSERTLVSSLSDHIQIFSDSRQVSATLEVDSDKDDAEIRTYRKRPERLKRVVNVSEQKKIDLLPTIDLVKVARGDVLTEITSQFTSTITKGLASFHEKSSTITGFVKDNLVNDDSKVEITSQFTSTITKGLASFQEKSSTIAGFVKDNLVNDDSKLKDAKFVYDDDRAKSIEAKSNINDEILKLSNAFAKLNEERQLLNEQASKQNVDISGVGDLNLDDHQSGKFYVDLPSGEASVPSTSVTTNLAVSDSSEGWDEWSKEDSLAILPDDALYRDKQFQGEQHLHFESECRKTEDSVGQAKSEDVEKEEIVAKLDFSVASNNQAVEEYFLETSKTLVETDCAYSEGWEDMLPSLNENQESEAVDIDNIPKTHPEVSCHRKMHEEKNKDITVPKKQESDTKKATETPDLDGWDDWNMSDNEDVDNISNNKRPKGSESGPVLQEVPKIDNADDGWGDWGEKHNNPKNESQSEKVSKRNNADEGWDDWGDDEFIDAPKENEEKVKEEARPIGSQASKASNEWTGWDSFGQKKDKDWGLGGWGINTLISTATAVTSNISAVIETGLGVPDPETMARIKVEEERARRVAISQSTGLGVSDPETMDRIKVEEETALVATSQSQFPFQQIVAGVGKIVEVAKVQEIGSRVLSGGLDTLETIGKKTMEVLQEGDPGLKKKRAILSEQGQILSKVLKEARDRAMEADRHSKELKTERRFHFETLFDDFQGLVHLEALEMLSKQCELRLEQIQQSLPEDKLDELQETLAEVKELCEVDEDFDNVEIDNFEQAITEVVAPLQNELSVAKILEVHRRLGEWLNSDVFASTANKMYDQAILTIAELTAAVTMQFHKSGELLILKERRKTVEEADCLMQLSSHLCYELKTITDNLSDRLGTSDQPDVSILISNLRVESENAIAYVKQAFQLLIPVIQLGAA